jgi:Putative prokaryotic signal transducing protein
MTSSDPVVVRQFFSTIEAELAAGALEAAGIDAMVSADDCGGMRPHMQVGRVALLVRPEDADEAIRILDAPADPVEDPS